MWNFRRRHKTVAAILDAILNRTLLSGRLSTRKILLRVYKEYICISLYINIQQNSDANFAKCNNGEKFTIFDQAAGYIFF